MLLLLACARSAPPEPPVVGDAERFGGSAFWVGDPHAHTGASGDAAAWDPEACPSCGRQEAVVDLAAEAGAHWLAVTDHVNGAPAMSEADFADMLARDGSHAGVLVVPGAEVWATGPDGALGHKTVLLLGDNDGLALSELWPTGTLDAALPDCDALWAWAEDLDARRGPVLVLPHHPAGTKPLPTDWACAHDRLQPVVEVYSEHGNQLSPDVTFDPPWAGIEPGATVHEALDPAGPALRMGFFAGTDAHDTLPAATCDLDLVRAGQPYGGGLTIVPLPEDEPLSREALADALAARRAYATSGPPLPLLVTWTVDGVVAGGMGDELLVPAGALVTVTVEVPADWAPWVGEVQAVSSAGATAMGGGDGTWTLALADVPAWVYVAVALDGALWVDGCDDGGELATEWVWGSPTWLDIL